MDFACLCNSNINVYRSEGNKQVLVQSITKNNISCFGWSESGNSILFGTEDGVCSVVSRTQKKMLEVKAFAEEMVSSVLFAGSYFYVGGPKVVKVFEAVPGKKPRLIAGLEGHEDSVTSLALVRASTSLVSSSSYGDILLHNLQKGVVSNVCSASEAEDEMGINKIAFKPKENSTLGSVAESGSFRLWDLNRCKSTPTFEPVMSFTNDQSHNGPATDLAFCELYSNLAVTVGLDGRVVLYDVRAKKNVNQMDTGVPIESVDFEKQEVVVGTVEHIEFYDLRKTSLKLRTSFKTEGAVEALSYSRSQSRTPYTVTQMPAMQLSKFVVDEGEGQDVEEEEEEEVSNSPRTPAKMLANPSTIFSPMNQGNFSASPSVLLSQASLTFFSSNEGKKEDETTKSPFFGLPITFDKTPVRNTNNNNNIEFEKIVQMEEKEEEKKEEKSYSIERERRLKEDEKKRGATPKRELKYDDGKEEHVQKTAVSDPSEMNAIKLQMHREIRAMHFEMLKMMHKQEQEKKKLEEEIRDLKRENERLRRDQRTF